MVLVTLCGMVAFTLVRHVGETYTPPAVAIVDNEDSVFSRILVRTVGKMDYISDLLSVERMREEEAEAAFDAGDCAAVILLPDGFTEDIAHGRQAEGQIILSPSMQSSATLVSSIARFGERMLVAGQNGVFCGERLLGAHRMPSTAYDAYYATSNTALIAEASSAADRYFAEETVTYLDTRMSSEAYFALLWTAALLFLTSLFFLPLFRADSTRAMLCRLRALGVRNGRFLSAKLILAASLRLLLLGGIFFLLCGAGMATADLRSMLSLLLGAVYISVIGGTLSLCMGNGVTSNVIFTVGGLFLCGGLVPRQLLPSTLTAAGALTPFGAAVDLLAPAFGGTTSPIALLTALLWFAAALLFLHVHLTRVRLGKGGDA